ncbi:MAG: hypothetical protein O3A00_06695 [Planctomycetota bacterium]|nr:hypothetical protein [Planctomycetota bacterium]
MTLKFRSLMSVVAVLTLGCDSQTKTSISAKSGFEATPTAAKSKPRIGESAKSPNTKMPEPKTDHVEQGENAKVPAQTETAKAALVAAWLNQLSPDSAKISALVSAQNCQPVVDFLRTHAPVLKRAQVPIDTVLGDFFDATEPQQTVLAFGAWSHQAANDSTTSAAIKPMLGGVLVRDVTDFASRIEKLNAHRESIPIAIDDGTTSVDSFKASVRIAAGQPLAELLADHAEKHDCVAVFGPELARQLGAAWLSTLPVAHRENHADAVEELDRVLVFADLSTHLQLNIIFRTNNDKIPPRLYGLIQNSYRARIDDVITAFNDDKRTLEEKAELAKQLSTLTQVFDSLKLIADGQLLELKMILPL